MQRAFVAIAHATATDAPALITGPTGVGKTLAARFIHTNSRRRHGPFVTLLCGALPEQLLESELFGHEKNAFTGAAAMRPGHLERAEGGTLFLDEIGDIPATVQAKLLRFVEEKTFNRVGGREDRVVDLRLITATHRRLREEVQAGRFREDLFYRLQVLEVAMPALAERREDIPVLCAMLLGRLAPKRELSLSRRHPSPAGRAGVARQRAGIAQRAGTRRHRLFREDHPAAILAANDLPDLPGSRRRRRRTGSARCNIGSRRKSRLAPPTKTFTAN